MKAAYFILGFLTILSVWSDDAYWTNPSSGNYTNIANWSIGAVPTVTDNTIFTNNATYTITFGAPPVSALNNFPLTNISANASFEAGSVGLNIKRENKGIITGANGNWIITGNVNVASLASAVASVEILTGNFIATNSADLVIGGEGSGSLKIGASSTASGSFTSRGLTIARDGSSSGLVEVACNSVIGPGGVLRITNDTGTATMTVGSAGHGTFRVGSSGSYGDVTNVTYLGTGTRATIDNLLATNLTIAPPLTINEKSLVYMKAGQLKTSSSLITVPNLYISVSTLTNFIPALTNIPAAFDSEVGAFVIGCEVDEFGTGFTWDMNGGTNLMSLLNDDLSALSFTVIGYGASFGETINVSGSNTLWDVHGYTLMGFVNPATVLTNYDFNGFDHEINITDGADVKLGQIYQGIAAPARITVSDTGSTFEIRQSVSAVLGLGVDGNTLEILNGAYGQFNGIRLGSVDLSNSILNGVTEGNVITVSGSGSMLSNNLNPIIVGDRWVSNQFTIASGGRVDTREFAIGSSTNGNRNFLRVTDNGSALEVFGTNAFTTAFVVGDRGSENFAIVKNGARLSVAGKSAIGVSDVAESNTVIVTDSGSIWSNEASLMIGVDGSHNSLIVTNGGIVYAQNLTVSSNNTLQLHAGNIYVDTITLQPFARINGIGDIAGLVTNGGIISTDLLNITGQLTCADSSTLEIELKSQADFDIINVDGPVALDGTLNIYFADDFENTVSNGDVFEIVTSSQNISGAFDNVISGQRLATAGGEGSFIVTYDQNKVILSNFLPPNTAPEVASLYCAQTSINGEGLVTISNTISDIDGHLCELRVLYSTNGIDWTNAWIEMATALYGTVLLSNDLERQVVQIPTTNELGQAATNFLTLTWQTTNAANAVLLCTDTLISLQAWDGTAHSSTMTSNPFWVDNAAPSSDNAIVTIQKSELGDYVVATNISCSWQNFEDTLSGIAGYYYDTQNQQGTANGTFTTDSNGHVSATADQMNTVYVWAKDGAGNIGQAASASALVLSPDGDIDADGTANSSEETAGTIATNDNSVFEQYISLTNLGGIQAIGISWPHATNRTYILYSTDDLFNPSPHAVTNPAIEIDQNMAHWVETNFTVQPAHYWLEVRDNR